MQADTFTLARPDGTNVHVHRWLPDDGSPRAVVQIAHGLAEHSARYARFAETLTAAGYAAYANDHRGHGATAGKGDRGYFADDHGFLTVVDDMAALTTRIEEEHPGLPVVLFGHSMGSFLARAYAAMYGEHIALLVLSGSAGDPGLLGRVGAFVASAEGSLRGRRHPSALMTKLTFGQYNTEFKPNRTDFDWLSRDDAEVDAYIADPWCGETATSGLYADLLDGLVRVNSDDVVGQVRADLPILVVSGDKDPVGENGKGVRQVADQLQRLGVSDVTVTLYPGARHEILNETNRDEVTADVLEWIGANLPD